MFYIAMPTVTEKKRSGQITRQVPTFYLDGSYLGIVSCEHAAKIVADVCNPSGSNCVTVSANVAQASELDFRRHHEMSKEIDYRDNAKIDARTFAEYLLDQIVDNLQDNGSASTDLFNDYGSDSYHHENHVAIPYSLTEAADILDQLDDYEETDSGLWEGLPPRRAIESQAAYTYGNAVYHMTTDIIDDINRDDEIERLIDLYNEAESLDEREQNDDGELESLPEWLSEFYPIGVPAEPTTSGTQSAISGAIRTRCDEVIDES